MKGSTLLKDPTYILHLRQLTILTWHRNPKFLFGLIYVVESEPGKVNREQET